MAELAPIAELYGADYQEQDGAARLQRLCDIVATNLAGLNFQMRYDFGALFCNGQIRSDAIARVLEKITVINPKMRGETVQGAAMRMLPYLLTTPVWYLRLVDCDRRKVYLVYVTPENMEAY